MEDFYSELKQSEADFFSLSPVNFNSLLSAHRMLVISVGYYSSAIASKCDLCPPGKSCNDPSATPADCGTGEYSLGGVVST